MAKKRRKTKTRKKTKRVMKTRKPAASKTRKSVASKTRRKLPKPYKPARLSKAANENLASAKPYEPDVLKDEDATSD